MAGPGNVPALSLHTFEVDGQHTDDTELGIGFAFRVVSDTPIVAHQFNPVDGASSFLSDAPVLFFYDRAVVFDESDGSTVAAATTRSTRSLRRTGVGTRAGALRRWHHAAVFDDDRHGAAESQHAMPRGAQSRGRLTCRPCTRGESR